MIRILLVEDDDNNRYALTELLRLEGYNVLSLSGGREAIEVLKKYKFDLIISDIKMPGVTGYNVIQEAKKIHPNTPFIFLTAYAAKSDEMVGYRMGCDRYVIKPYSIEMILGTIRDLLRGYS